MARAVRLVFDVGSHPHLYDTRRAYRDDLRALESGRTALLKELDGRVLHIENFVQMVLQSVRMELLDLGVVGYHATY